MATKRPSNVHRLEVKEPGHRVSVQIKHAGATLEFELLSPISIVVFALPKGLKD